MKAKQRFYVGIFSSSSSDSRHVQNFNQLDNIKNSHLIYYNLQKLIILMYEK